MSMPATRHRFTIEDWHQRIEAGVLRDDQRVELLDGEIFEMTPIGLPHLSVVDRLTRFWVTALSTRAIVRVQGSVPAGPTSEPQPDLAVLTDRPDFYRSGHPVPDDVLLIIEVADSSVDYDRAKLRFYAAAGTREVWIVDIPGDRVEVHRRPGPFAYEDRRIVARGERLTCLAFPDVTLAVDEILG